MPLPSSFPELASLDLFCSVVRLGSLSRAAQAHGVAQPSASARIRHLERQIGVTLLHRSPSGSSPTQAGVLLAEWAQSILGEAAKLAAGVEALQSRRGGRLQVAASNTVAEHLLPGWLAALRRSHPDATVELEVTNSARVIQAVQDNRTDLGFIESPGTTKGLSWLDVAADELVVVVAPDHPWTRRRGPLAPAVLAATPLVTREAGSGTRDALDNALRCLELQPVGPAVELGSTTAVKAAVMAGAGPAVLSHLAVHTDLAEGRLVVITVKGIDLKRRLRAVWPTGRQPEGPAAGLLAAAQRARS